MRSIASIFSLVLMGFFSLTVAGNAQERLTVYTYDAFAAEWGPGPLLKAGFEKTCECTLDFVAADSSIGALRKVQLEGAESEADIVLGLDSSLTAEAAATSLFAPHEIDLSGLEVPDGWQSDLFVPFDHGFFAFVYDKRRLDKVPASFRDLIAASDDLKIVIQDPRSSTPGLGLVLWIRNAYGNDAPAIWEGLAPHILTVARSWSDAYALFLKGEADMVLSYTTSPAYHLIGEDDPNYDYARFVEGHYAQIESAGILSQSGNKDLARAFLTYLVSDEGQSFIPETNWMYPVRPIALPEGFAEFPAPATVLLFNDEAAHANGAEWSQEALNALR